MSDVILVKPEDVTRFTSLNGSVDVSKYVQYIKIAQDIHGMNYLGEKLLDKIKEDVRNSTLSGVYYELVNDHLKYMLLHWAMVEYLPFALFSISGKGVFKHTSENSESVSKAEIEYLLNKEKNVAEGYTNKMLLFIKKNIDFLPEYKDNDINYIKPKKKVNYGGWYL